MSKGARIFLVVAMVWLALWAMGSVLFFRGARSSDGEAERLAMPLTGLVRGSDVRFEGTVNDQHPVTAPLSEQPCAAAQVQISYVTWDYDSQHKVRRYATHVATRLVPQSVDIVVGDQRVALPLELWKPPASKSGDVTQAADEVPARLQVTDDEIARAAGNDRENFVQFTLEEWKLLGGQQVFIVGHLEERGGRLQLAPDAALGKVVLFRGTQADAVRDLGGTASGLRIAGAIFAALAVLPLLGFGLTRLRKRRPT